MKKININNWTLFFDCDSFSQELENSIKNLTSLTAVKENNKRKIFHIKIKNSSCFLKLHLAKNFKAKVYSLFKNKALSEYNSCKLLQKKGFEVADYFAWGINTNGETLLISQELENSQTARSYYYNLTMDEFNRPLENNVGDVTKELKIFIEQLKELLGNFIKKKIYHPDLHFGNLLWEVNKQKICLIDPYGIKKVRTYTAKQKFNVLGIIVGLRNYFSLEELAMFCVDIQLYETVEEALIFLEKYLQMQFDSNKDWSKRFKQILAGRTKYNLRIKDFDNSEEKCNLYVRCGFNEQLLETVENCADEAYLQEKYFAIEYINKHEARKIYLESFIDEYDFIKQYRKPIIMKKFPGKIIIYFTNN
ncbi:hypothetical protein AAEX28_13780 [Lentisphaerota bacterium WC36G]|nr:hypothetical protein LJT99_00530 [Lentisphaerae bacterium WC36]